MRDTFEEMRFELFEAQQETIASYQRITKLQSEAITDLFRLLSLHEEVDEASTAAIVEKINEAAILRAELEF